MMMRGNIIHPDKRKGLVYVHQSSDSLIHFCWKDRQSGNVEDDWIIFPYECEFVRVPQCTTGRVFFSKFKFFNMKLIFGMQEPNTDQDETYSQKVNEYLNNPPTPGSQQDLQSLLSSMSRQQLIKLFGNVGEVSCLSSLLIPSDGNMLSGSSRSSDATFDSASQARSAAAISAATTSSFANVVASKGVTASMVHDTVQSPQLGQSVGLSVPATPSSTGVPSLGNLTNDQQILSGIQVLDSPLERPEKPSDLSYGLSLNAIHAILKKPDLVRQLRDCLFPSDQASKGVTASMVQDTVQSPQLGQVYEDDCIFQREVTFVPGLYQIFDELLVNAADNKIKDISMDTIRVDIDLKSNIIKIFYNGEGIPVV
ncbi:proteasomal ubiquitin receptor ADRM1-like [Daphnia pulex]|uniref:proteasomal ubiquitin receptor ADRM1-like n=1 Tax=Daphnia pulex TaxID=6669 RepID=UPI001EDFC4B1|nr:proteasomal ubiquitin receptor ADRM1-like [Daphnia pulex]